MYDRRAASDVTDGEIAEVVLAYLAKTCAGEHTNRSLREEVALTFRAYTLQTRRVARVVSTLADEGRVATRTAPGAYGTTLVWYSAVRP